MAAIQFADSLCAKIAPPVNSLQIRYMCDLGRMTLHTFRLKIPHLVWVYRTDSSPVEHATACTFAVELASVYFVIGPV